MSRSTALGSPPAWSVADAGSTTMYIGPAPSEEISRRSRPVSEAESARSASGSTYTGRSRSSPAALVRVLCACAGAAATRTARRATRARRGRIVSRVTRCQPVQPRCGIPARPADPEPDAGGLRDGLAVWLDGAALAPLRRRLLVALPDLRARRVHRRPGPREGGLHGRRLDLPRGRGECPRGRRGARRPLAADARRAPSLEPAQAAAPAVPWRERSPLRRGDGGRHRARGRELARGRGGRAAAADAGDHARGDPARGLRGARRRADGHVPPAH